MGNNPSTNNRPANAASPTPSAHGHGHGYGHGSSSKPPSARRDPRNLIQAQRAPAEPSLAQASGTTAAIHRTRNSQSQPQAQPASPLPLNHQSVSQSSSTPSSSPQSTQHSKPEPIDVRDLPSKPVDVPVSATNYDASYSRSYSNSIDPSGPPATQDMSYHLTRPPRLPLPIEEEVHTPGSPIIAPADVDAPALDIEALDNETLPRRSSALSNTTIDDEDAEELRVDKTGATVPTTFEWSQGGDKVYVTGTIFQWNKKHRLHPIDGQPGLLRAVVNVRPGTHHIRFIVDSMMQCSSILPTTVDFGNNLVNYIEVSADDIPRDIGSSNQTDGELDENTANELLDAPKPEDSNEETGIAKPPSRTKPVLPPGRYSSQVPQYLVDLDKAEDSSAYQYAATAIEKLPTPPSLPGFLGKPILNAATPMKDDNSVLTMPNHTVLNHLATSSIKNNVLAVSATTRYKRKYVTTIMYKPTGTEE